MDNPITGESAVDEEVVEEMAEELAEGAVGAEQEAPVQEDPASVSDFSSAMPSTPGMRLARLALAHFFVLLLALSLFGAADAWVATSGLGIASVLGVITGAIAGAVVSNLIHEWSHLLGALFTNARYTVPAKLGLFLYDWDFEKNNVRQFEIMSVAGSVGGILAIVILWNSVPADTVGRAALQAGAIASFVFGSSLEWPVLYRTRRTGQPFAELSKISGPVLGRSFAVALVVLVVSTNLIAP